jgi:hypothetical protein
VWRRTDPTEDTAEMALTVDELFAKLGEIEAYRAPV